MNREEAEAACFNRDGGCVVPWCDKEAQDAHHIIERKLWDDGGYFLENLASVCHEHHKDAEENRIPPQAFWMWIGETPETVKVPHQVGNCVNKWGDVYRKPVLRHIKYPTTRYLENSPSFDDERNEPVRYTDMFEEPLVLTIKMDGSNACLTRDRVAARNGQDAPHRSFDMLKAFHQRVSYLIPAELQIFGEWLYAKHSIFYGEDAPALENYFQIFGVYHQDWAMWLSWHEVLNWADTLRCITVPEVELPECSNPYELMGRVEAINEKVMAEGHEGVVLRTRLPMMWAEHGDREASRVRIGKMVRENHVQTDTHWSHQKIVRNFLDDEKP